VAINKDLKERAQKTCEDGVFTLKLDEGISLAMLVSFTRDTFPGMSTEDIGVWPADDGELVVSLRGGGAVASPNTLNSTGSKRGGRIRGRMLANEVTCWRKLSEVL